MSLPVTNAFPAFVLFFVFLNVSLKAGRLLEVVHPNQVVLHILKGNSCRRSASKNQWSPYNQATVCHSFVQMNLKLFFSLFSFLSNNKLLKHITSAECIYVSHCEFLLNRTRGMTLLLQCFVRLSNAFEEILPWMLLAIIKICHSKTALGWLDRKWNWFETFVSPPIPCQGQAGSAHG